MDARDARAGLAGGVTTSTLARMSTDVRFESTEVWVTKAADVAAGIHLADSAYVRFEHGPIVGVPVRARRPETVEEVEARMRRTGTWTRVLQRWAVKHALAQRGSGQGREGTT